MAIKSQIIKFSLMLTTCKIKKTYFDLIYMIDLPKFVKTFKLNSLVY